MSIWMVYEVEMDGLMDEMVFTISGMVEIGMSGKL